MTLKFDVKLTINFKIEISFWTISVSEAATGGVQWKKMFLEILQNSQEKNCARVSFLIKLQASGTDVFQRILQNF